MPNTYGAVMVGRNDNYGGDLVERASYAFNAALESLDELIYVDWGSEGRTLAEEIKDNLIYPSKLQYVVVTPEMARYYTRERPDAQAVNEVLGRNIGLRRLSTDFLISTNIDVLVPPREYLETIVDADLFSPIPKYMISLQNVRDAGGIRDDVRSVLISNIHPSGDLWGVPGMGKQGPVSVCDGDIWSVVNGCGDFQVAHRDIWYAIRGFEESLLGRGYGDSNVNKKAWLKGFKLDARWDLFVFHIGHGGSTAGGGGGTGYWNDVNFALKNFAGTTNPETWGFSNDETIKVRTLT